MLITELPQPLQEEFERTAKRVYATEGVKRASIEAAALWLTQHREQRRTTLEVERLENDQAYEHLRATLERDHLGQWFVIAHGELQGVGDSLEAVEHLTTEARDRIVMQVEARQTIEVEFGWQMTFN